MKSDAVTLAVGVLMTVLGLVVAIDLGGINERWMRLPWPLAMMPRKSWVYRATGAGAVCIGIVWIAFALV
jgi:hypothetical protein